MIPAFLIVAGPIAFALTALALIGAHLRRAPDDEDARSVELAEFNLHSLPNTRGGKRNHGA